MMRRPTKRAVVVGGIGTLLVLAGATAQAGWLFVLAAGVLGLVAGSFIIKHRLAGVEVDRRMPQRARVGDEIRAGLAVHNTSRSSVPMFAVEDSFGAFDPVSVGVERLAPDARAEIELVRVAAHRGVFEEGNVVLTSGAPFGLARSRRARTIRSPLTVVPRWVELSSFPILEPSSSPSDVLHERARTGAGEEYLGTREYRPGDPMRAVHWRSTARVGKLIVREYQQEISSTVGLVLGGPDHGAGPGSSFESLVAAAASIGVYSLQTGHPIHIARDHDGGIAYLGSTGKHDLLDWLAAARPFDGSVEDVVTEMLGRVGRRGTIVLCVSTAGSTGASIDASVARIQRAGARAIVVAARASTWAPAAGEVVLDRRLGDGRVPVREIVRGKDLESCLAG